MIIFGFRILINWVPSHTASKGLHLIRFKYFLGLGQLQMSCVLLHFIHRKTFCNLWIRVTLLVLTYSFPHPCHEAHYTYNNDLNRTTRVTSSLMLQWSGNRYTKRLERTVSLWVRHMHIMDLWFTDRIPCPSATHRYMTLMLIWAQYQIYFLLTCCSLMYWLAKCAAGLLGTTYQYDILDHFIS